MRRSHMILRFDTPSLPRASAADAWRSHLLPAFERQGSPVGEGQNGENFRYLSQQEAKPIARCVHVPLCTGMFTSAMYL